MLLVSLITELSDEFIFSENLNVETAILEQISLLNFITSQKNVVWLARIMNCTFKKKMSNKR